MNNKSKQNNSIENVENINQKKPIITNNLDSDYLAEKIYSQLSQDSSSVSSRNQEKTNYHISQLSQTMQLKFSQSKILLINLTSCITELCKLLITAGFSLYIHDTELVSKTDAINNIFLSNEDIDKPRLDTLYNKLILLNSTISIIKLKDITKVKDYKIAIVGFSDFETLMEYEEYFNRKGVIYLCINTSGLYSFCYHNLTEKMVDNFCSDKNKKLTESHNSNGNNFLKKENRFIQNGKIKTENEGIIAAVFLMEIYYRKNIHKTLIKEVLKKELNGDTKFIEKMYYIENYLKKLRKDGILKNQFFIETIRNLIINFNRELNPICSTMAKKVFEFLFIIFRDKTFSKEIMFTYNSDNLRDFNYESFI